MDDPVSSLANNYEDNYQQSAVSTLVGYLAMLGPAGRMTVKDERAAQAMVHFGEIAEELNPGGVLSGSLFGKPSLKIGTKAFACQFRDGVAFKLSPDVHAVALGLAGAELFDPSGKGRPMKEWVQVPVDHAQRWLEFARQALQYVRG